MRYVFGTYEFDTSLYALRRAGQLIRLRPKVFQVLTYLLTHRDRVVSRYELCEQVWPDQHISDTALETTIRAVRQVIGDSGREQRMIQTLHGHGYRFIAAVEVQALPDETQGTLPVAKCIDAAPHSASWSSVAERKLVTILSCAAVHTPAQRQQLGIEALYNRIRTLYDLVRHEIQQYAGTLQPVTGECVLAVFGVPMAQEDHAQRAVLAALNLCEQLHRQRVSQDASPEDALIVHIGVHTGEVVAGGMGDSQEAMTVMVGHTVTLTTALQEHAAPGTILCSHATARLVRDVVRVRRVRPIQGAEQPTPVAAYQVLGRVPQRALVVQQVGRPLSQFVGRAAEMATLHSLLAQVQQGQGQVIGIVGEPGIGKSRLVYEFHRSVHRERLTYLAGRCLSYGQTTPYLPWLDLVRHACGLTPAEPPETVGVKVYQQLQEVGMMPEEWAPYLLHFLEVPERPDLLKTLSPQAIKARMFETLVQLCLHSSHQRPLVVEVENLHWLDATSEEGLTTLVERLAGAPLLLVTTYRPGYHPPWMDKSYVTQLVLQRLTPDDSRRVVQGMLRMGQVSAELVQEILLKADGNPFFLEELVRAAMEHGEDLSAHAIPDTVQAVLMARIDRLQPADKQLLQNAAVIGKDVPLPLLQAITAVSDEALHRGLRNLQAAEFLYETHAIPERTHTFKHALTQEVAYASLLMSTRQQVHQQIAQVLEEQFAEVAENQPELLAHHLTEAGLNEQAVGYWHKAGQRAVERSANLEAIRHLTKGLEVLATLPDTPERIQHELTLQLALGIPLTAAKGWAAPDVESVYTRAWELCQKVEDTSQLFPVLRGLWNFYNTRAELQTARDLAAQLLRVAQRQHDPELLIAAYRALGSNAYWLGEFPTARVYLEQMLALYEPQQHHAMAFLYGTDPGVHGLSYMALTLWLLGYPDQALQRSHEALTMARAGRHTYSLGLALYFASWLHHLRRELLMTWELAETTIALSTEQGFPFWIAAATVQCGWVLAEQGQVEAGMVQIRQSLAMWRGTGARQKLPFFLALLAEACGKITQTREGLTLLAEALALVDTTKEHLYEAELHRLKGELLLQPTVRDERRAEICFCRALHIAHRQQAKSLELRAAVSLGRLWLRQDKGAEARDMLAPVYHWFTEGFDTPDLQGAKALLEA